MKDPLPFTPTAIALALAGILIVGAVVFSNRPTSKPQADSGDIVVPVTDSQPSDIQTFEDLRSEVATLKKNLDDLYTAHSQLVKDHNQLLQYTTELSVTISNTSKNLNVTGLQRSTPNSSSDLERKLNTIQNTVDNICEWVFGFNYTGCPSFNPEVTGNINDRLKKLERGY